MTDLNELSAQEIGRRLRIARDNADISQDIAARVIKKSRPTLVAIEQGSRRIRIHELQILANYYNVSANAILRREAVHIDLFAHFRKFQDTEDKNTLESVRLLHDLVKAEVELENILGIRHRRNYPLERGINNGDVIVLAEKHAQELRDWLGMGSGAINDIFSLIENDLGIRLYQRRMPSTVAGLFSYNNKVGACILLNSNHPLEMRIYSAAHELGHFIGTRQVPALLASKPQLQNREEKYANAFGRAFLTPAKSFEKSFRQLTAGCERLTRRHIILLARQNNISREACGRRLEELGLVRKGSWAWFEANGNITNKQAREVLGAAFERLDPAKQDTIHDVSHRMSLMAHATWKRGIMSEGQLANLLKIGRIELRKIIDQIDLDECDTDDLHKFSN